MQWIYETVTLKHPVQLKCPVALWTAKMVTEGIQRHRGVKLSKAAVCRLLRQLGLTPPHPVWCASQQHPEAVPRWLHEE
jgi:transposase